MTLRKEYDDDNGRHDENQIKPLFRTYRNLRDPRDEHCGAKYRDWNGIFFGHGSSEIKYLKKFTEHNANLELVGYQLRPAQYKTPKPAIYRVIKLENGKLFPRLRQNHRTAAQLSRADGKLFD